MKKALLTISVITGFIAATAQVPEDVLRYSFFAQHGTARNMAIGGAMGSLGGDVSALFINPAGLGLYKTREVVLSPGFIFNNNKGSFRGTEEKATKSGFDLGATGIVIGYNNPRSKWTSQAFSFGINQTANFNNTVSYKGSNNFSSFSEQFAEEISKSGQDISTFLQTNTPYAWGSSQAYYTYLVDTFNNVVRALPEFLLDQGIALNQENRIETKGGIYELALGYSANMDDRFYVGASLGVPIYSYDRFTQFNESDATGDPNNNFNFFKYNTKLTTKGWGINAKLGIIFKPVEQFRLGLAIHTPTWYSLTDKYSTDLTTDTEGFGGLQAVTSSTFAVETNGISETKYLTLSPWKFIASGSYVFREVNDTRKQRAFITADIEYVTYNGTTFRADGDNVTSDDEAYYDDLKDVIKSTYKNAFNFRLGGELKFNTVMFRLGGGYYTNPYKDAALKANITQLSGGLGYRNHGVFIDLTYAHILNKDVNFPYRLTDKANTFATEKNTRGNVVLTVGFKI